MKPEEPTVVSVDQVEQPPTPVEEAPASPATNVPSADKFEGTGAPQLPLP